MNAIKTAREFKKLSQTDLATRVGCTQTHISALERGEKTASPTLAKKLAAELSLPVVNVIYPSEEE